MKKKNEYNAMKKAESTEFSTNLVYVGRCAKVGTGGRTFRFLAIVVVGDGKGRVGFGSGKAAEVMDAKEKATKAAMKKIIKIQLREGRTLHHDISASYGAGKVKLRPAPPGTGIIAGGPMRVLLESLGVADVVAKSIGTNNPFNMLHASMAALMKTESPRSVADRRGKKPGEIVGRRDNKVVRNNSIL